MATELFFDTNLCNVLNLKVNLNVNKIWRDQSEMTGAKGNDCVVYYGCKNKI